MPLPIPLWMLAAGALGTGVGLGIQNSLNNESELKNKGNELLNAHLEDIQERQKRIEGEIFYMPKDPLTELLSKIPRVSIREPNWVEKVAEARASDKYQNWLRNSQDFELGGNTYRWVEEGSDEYNKNRFVRGRSNKDIARMYAQANTKDPGQYQGSWENLLNERRRLTGKRYVPIALP